MMNLSHKSLWATCLMTGALMFGACTSTPPTVKEISIVPVTSQLEETQGIFELKGSATIGVTDPNLKPAAEYLLSILAPATGYELKVVDGEGTITLSLDQIADKEGAYTFNSTPTHINITGNTYAGVIAGIETFRQLLPNEIECDEEVRGMSWGIPTVNITDVPRYEWRGMMLDVSRHFYTVEEVKNFLDVMALYKMNKFHWHLTDDQGWRIEIKKYPLLTEKGAWRTFNSHDRDCIYRAKNENNPDMELNPELIQVVEGDTLYGGFYTQDDIRDVVAYAQVRGIDIIPEIDMPGHMLAGVSNYDGVSCFSETGWGHTFSSPVCPGKESAMEFCKNIYEEVIELFPYEYVHVGGDEVEKSNWKKCPDCQKRIRTLGLKNEEELQSWFIHEMEHFFNSKGKKMLGWDEIIEGGLSETATITWWRSWAKDAPAVATSQGNEVICCPNGQFYFDYQEDRNSIPSIYNFTLSDQLNAEQLSLIKGVQANIWCEWIPSNARMEYMAIPRLLAVAELGWADPSHHNLEAFRTRLADQFERLNLMGINYRVPDLEGFQAINAFIGEGTVSVTCLDPTASIHYTTDGTIPTLDSPTYEGEFAVTETTNFTFRTFRSNGKPSDIFKTRFVKDSYAPATTDASPSNPGLKATWHEFKGNKCANITSAPVNGTYTVEDVMIPKKAKGNIGLVIKGYLNAPKDDIYTFALLSDDGSTLHIDGDLIVDNDGPHGPKEIIGQKALGKGYHPIEVRYFDQNGGQLKLIITGSDGQVIPFTHLYAH